MRYQLQIDINKLAVTSLVTLVFLYVLKILAQRTEEGEDSLVTSSRNKLEESSLPASFFCLVRFVFYWLLLKKSFTNAACGLLVIYGSTIGSLWGFGWPDFAKWLAEQYFDRLDKGAQIKIDQ